MFFFQSFFYVNFEVVFLFVIILGFGFWVLMGCFSFVDMAPLYETLVANKIFDLDQKALDLMRNKIEEELMKLDEK